MKLPTLACLITPLLALIPAAAIAATQEEGAAGKTKPNILFIAVDDLRTELGCYGNTHIKSPHIDRLAETGVTFKRAYCQQAVCNPSRASLMTGLRPDSLRVWDLVTDFRTTVPDAVTIPQHFRKHGYRALSYGKIFHNPLPDQVSWDEPHRWPEKAQLWSDAARKRFKDFRQQLRDEGKNEYMINRLRPPAVEIVDIPDSEHVDGAIADETIAAMRRLAKDDQPFFLATGFIRPHLPFVVPRKYWDLYDRNEIPLAPNQSFPKGMPEVAYGKPSFGGFYELRVYMDYLKAPTPFERPLAEARQRELKHGYYASVSFVDAQVGRMLAELDRLGLRDNTIIVLWGDHGWKLGEHGGWCKQTNFEVDTHAPLIIRAPNAKANGGKSASLVEFIDIYPTLCELAGLPVPEVLEGVSLASVLNDVSVKVKDAAFSQFPHNLKGKNYMGYTMRTDRYRLVEWLDRMTGKTVATELYDHQSDPQENTNIADRPESRETVRSLDTRLQRMIPRPLPKQARPVLTIRNRRTTPVVVYWLKPDGSRLERARLAPGKSFKSNTTIGHKFVVEDEDGGNPRTIEVKKKVQVEIVIIDEIRLRFGPYSPHETPSRSAGVDARGQCRGETEFFVDRHRRPELA
jgi:iduronate 2-sulfatase